MQPLTTSVDQGDVCRSVDSPASKERSARLMQIRLRKLEIQQEREALEEQWRLEEMEEERKIASLKRELAEIIAKKERLEQKEIRRKDLQLSQSAEGSLVAPPTPMQR
jgi:hypothetical protein